MPQVRLSKLQRGSVLNANVISPMGGILMEKGTKILDREYEILLAFQVESVEIESGHPPEGYFSPNPFNEPSSIPSPPKPKRNDEIQPESEPKPKDTSLTFERKFVNIAQYYKAVFQAVAAGKPVPIKELREQLQPLLTYSADPNNILYTLKQLYAIKDFIYFHSIAVGFISVCIARWSKIDEQEMMDIALTGVLHDIGKTRILPSILTKPEALSEDEWKEMRKYPVYGYHLIKNLPTISDRVTLGVLQHQEREDGSGYPLSLKTGTIHSYAKIVAIADIFHSMCSAKSYWQGTSPYLTLEELLADSFGRLNPTFVHHFVDGMARFSIGTLVELSNGLQGKIVFVDSTHPTRPMVDVNGSIINLALNRNLVIMRVVI